MKKLQNNFTTPEQSKRLLELGVPAKSADCFWSNPIGSKMYAAPIVRNKLSYRCKDWFKKNNYFYTPCWSAGQLIVIICNCHIITHQLTENWICCDEYTNLIELLISYIEVYIATGHMDFSKLEE